MWPAVLAVVAALTSLGGCATGARAFRCPAHGGPPWLELASDHFVVRTDLPAPDAAALLGRFERMRAAVAAALPQAPPAGGRVEIIAFRSVEEYADFAPDAAAGYYLRSEGGPPRIVLTGELVPWQRALLAHELTHHFLAGVFQRQPRWFAEGLATYMESLGTGDAEGAISVGTPPAKRLERVRRSPIPARRLLEWDGTARGRSAALDLYASSWLLVHWFVHREPEAFARLQTRLAAGDAPADAWRAALPERDPGRAGALDALDRELAEYARGDFAPRVRTVEVPKAIGYFEQVVPSPEVHAIRLALWSRGPEKGLSALRAEVDEALEEDAAHPVALQYRAALDGVDPLRLARASVDAHGDDPRAWSFLAHSLVDPAAAAEREAAYRRAAELAPDNAAALHNLAQELLEQGRSGEALPVARQAAHLAPWSPTVLAGFASVLSDLGQCDAAVPVQQRAVDALPEALPARERRAFTDRLERYARQCRPTGAPASGTGSGT